MKMGDRILRIAGAVLWAVGWAVCLAVMVLFLPFDLFTDRWDR